VRSDYRPAIAVFSVLREVGQGSGAALDLEMHPHEAVPIRYRIERFLRREDFRWINPTTGRSNAYQFSSVKTRAVASARKALPTGAAVVFAANKRGNQGEIGEAELIRLATELADQTFASRQAAEASKQLLRGVFTLRAQRVLGLKANGRLEWVRETGARVRMVDVVESSLLPMRPTWDDVVDPIAQSLVNPILEWAWTQRELQQKVREAYRVAAEIDLGTVKEGFFSAVRLWLDGSTLLQIAEGAGRSIDELLGVHSQVLTFALQTIVEQAIALLEKVLQSQGRELAPAVRQFPEHLRFGVPSAAGCTLAAGGVSHRKAFVEIGKVLRSPSMRVDDRAQVFDAAQQSLEAHRDQWRTHLGTLVFQRTMHDLSSVTRRRPADE